MSDRERLALRCAWLSVFLWGLWLARWIIRASADPGRYYGHSMESSFTYPHEAVALSVCIVMVEAVLVALLLAWPGRWSLARRAGIVASSVVLVGLGLSIFVMHTPPYVSLHFAGLWVLVALLLVLALGFGLGQWVGSRSARR